MQAADISTPPPKAPPRHRPGTLPPAPRGGPKKEAQQLDFRGDTCQKASSSLTERHRALARAPVGTAQPAWHSSPVARRHPRTCRRCRRSARRPSSLAAPPRRVCQRPRSHPYSRRQRQRQSLGHCGRHRAGSWADARPARCPCHRSTSRPTASLRATAITGRPWHLAGWRHSARRKAHRHSTARPRDSRRGCARSTPA